MSSPAAKHPDEQLGNGRTDTATRQSEDSLAAPAAALPWVVVLCAESESSLREELLTHLRILADARQLRLWHGGMIQPGLVERKEMAFQLERARIVVVLVSADLFSSQAVAVLEEVLQRSCAERRVVPILVRRCTWEITLFEGVRMLPSNGVPVTMWRDRDDAWTGVAAMIGSLLGKKDGRSVAAVDRAGVPPTPSVHRPSGGLVLTLALALVVSLVVAFTLRPSSGVPAAPTLGWTGQTNGVGDNTSSTTGAAPEATASSSTATAAGSGGALPSPGFSASPSSRSGVEPRGRKPTPASEAHTSTPSEASTSTASDTLSRPSPEPEEEWRKWQGHDNTP